jgi:hypothetical protein
LHPSGKPCSATYELIGKVYKGVQSREPFCEGAIPLSDIGVFNPEELGFICEDTEEDTEFPVEQNIPHGIVACNRMLEELGCQFDIIDSHADLERYKVLILPDCIGLTPEVTERLQRYLAQGGSLIATFESGLDIGKSQFVGEFWPMRKSGEGPVDDEGLTARGRNYYNNSFTEYLIPNEAIGQGLPEVEHVMYYKGLDVEAVEGAEVLQRNVRSLFDRCWNHYCSHLQTPSSGEPGLPAVLQKGRVIYFSHPLFDIAAAKAPVWVRTMLGDALQRLHPKPLVQHNGPSTLLVTLTNQPTQNRYVLHVLHYIAVKKAEELEIIENSYDSGAVDLILHLPQAIQHVEYGLNHENRTDPEWGPVSAESPSDVQLHLKGCRGHEILLLSYSPSK